MVKPLNRKRKKRKLLRFFLVLLVLAILAALAYKPVKTFVMKKLYPVEYTTQVQQWAGQNGVDEYLVYAIIRTESGFDPDAQSSAGAIGLMQMTRDTFEWLNPQVAPGENLVFEDLYQPEVSIRFGVYFYSMCLKRYDGDVSTAAAAYHSGWGTVDKLLQDESNTETGTYLSNFPYSQMNHYVYKINNSYEVYKELYTEIP